MPTIHQSLIATQAGHVSRNRNRNQEKRPLDQKR